MSFSAKAAAYCPSPSPSSHCRTAGSSEIFGADASFWPFGDKPFKSPSLDAPSIASALAGRLAADVSVFPRVIHRRKSGAKICSSAIPPTSSLFALC
jgi:hypothetical protein